MREKWRSGGRRGIWKRGGFDSSGNSLLETEDRKLTKICSCSGKSLPNVNSIIERSIYLVSYC